MKNKDKINEEKKRIMDDPEITASVYPNEQAAEEFVGDNADWSKDISETKKEKRKK